MSKNIKYNNSEISENNSSDVSLSDDDVLEHSDNLELEGKILGNYNILSKLGAGAYSIVWLGYDINKKIFYAIKVQNPNEYKEGIQENSFMKKLPKKNLYFNHLIDEFIHERENKKFICSVYNLHYGNIDTLIRKEGTYNDGIPLINCINIIKQLFTALSCLHNELNVCHCDIKSDNILLRGVSSYNNLIINLYNKNNFNEKYLEEKKKYSLKYNKKIKIKTKNTIRNKIHTEIYNNIKKQLDDHSQSDSNLDKYNIDTKYINECSISLADFGSFTSKGEYYDESFGTRYYRSPENILVGKASFPNDIWALGCTIYELLTGSILFNPDKDKEYNRDFYHLKLINEISGEFPLDFLKQTQDWKIYFNNNGLLKFNKNLDNKNILEDTLKNIITDTTILSIILKLIKGMLEINPIKRLKINDCIKIINQIKIIS
jgi:serine/threonine-protein kinase SRPK3